MMDIIAVYTHTPPNQCMHVKDDLTTQVCRIGDGVTCMSTQRGTVRQK